MWWVLIFFFLNFINHVMVFFFFFDFDFVKKKKSWLWHIPVGIMNCFVYKGFNFQEIVVDYFYMSFPLCNTLALLSIFLSVHICVCFVFWPRNDTFFLGILNINLLKVWDFANFANNKIDGFCWNCISCLAELYWVHELLVMIFFNLISKG